MDDSCGRVRCLHPLCMAVVNWFYRWLILFSTFGYLYSFGVYEDFYVLQFLTNHTPSSIAWIGSFQLMMPFALGIVSGKLFDGGYFHAVEIAGGALFSFSVFMLSLAKSSHQGVGMGLGAGLTFVPSVTITSYHFSKRRSLATGVVMSGSSAGATIFPIMLKSVFIPRPGCQEFLYRRCLPLGHPWVHETQWPKRLVRKGGHFLSFLVQHSVGSSIAFYSFRCGIAIMNGAGAFGRIAANYLADMYGPFNLQVMCTLVTACTIWAVLGVHTTGTLVLVSTLYGIFSGAWLALSIAVLASLARNPDEVGARTGIALALGSFGCLGSAPIQGALLTRKFFWLRPIAFSAVRLITNAQSIVIASACCFAWMTLLARRRGPNTF
ncbi:MFS general substrate transporter [Mycena leptocephala]|nr:MFS general substrate transporter [Mycena leptocephala]